jgi:hypothetical protein
MMRSPLIVAGEGADHHGFDTARAIVTVDFKDPVECFNRDLELSDRGHNPQME